MERPGFSRAFHENVIDRLMLGYHFGSLTDIRVIAFINNAISARLLILALKADGHDLSEVALFCGRKLDLPWVDQCPIVIDYAVKPSLTFFGQHQVLGFFRRSAALARELSGLETISEIYLVNNDNLITNHFLNTKKLGGFKGARISVLAEGLMNYQDIGTEDRAGWRWKAKPVLARLLRLKYVQPIGHLSGSEDISVDRVISFAERGLKSPAHKIQIIAFPSVRPKYETRKNTLLILHTGLWQWMEEDKYLVLAVGFVKWIKHEGFDKILVKPHPHIKTGVVAELLPPHETLDFAGGIEAFADDLTASTVVGTCCTALATLKIIRPDLRCVDFGSDFYCKFAYHDDYSVVDFLEGLGVEIVKLSTENDVAAPDLIN